MTKFKVFLPVLAVAIVAGVSMFFTACQKETLADEEYLSIPDVNKSTFTQEEWRIIKEADKRMSRYLVVENNKLSLQGKTAADLNMDVELFNQWYKVIDFINSHDIELPLLQQTITKSLPDPPGYPEGGILNKATQLVINGYFSARGYILTDIARLYRDIPHVKFRMEYSFGLCQSNYARLLS